MQPGFRGTILEMVLKNGRIHRKVFAMKRAGIVLTGLALFAFVAEGQASNPPKNIDEAWALAKVRLDAGVSPQWQCRYRVGALLVDEEFEALEFIANEFRESKERWGYGHWKLESFYYGCEFGRGFVKPRSQPIPYLQRCERWVAKYPDSITAKIALARVRMELAWNARGGGWASEVKEEGWAGMQRHLNAAWEVLKEAEALPTSDPDLYSQMILTAKLKGQSYAELRALYEKGLEVERGYPPLYMSHAWTMMPRWGGALGDVEAFAREAVEDAKSVPGTGPYVWIANDYRGMTATTTFIHRFDWSSEDLKAGFEDILSVYPDDRWIQNIRARLSSLMEDKEESKKAFAIIGRDFDTEVWPDKFVYGRWKRWAENDADWPGGNGIHYGVRWDNPKLCEAYLDGGAAIDATDETGYTPLHYAASIGKLHAAKFLIERGADVSDGKGTMLTPLQTASTAGHVELVKLLIEHGADPTKGAKLTGSTPLITAAANRRFDVVKLLLEQPSIEVDVQDKQGRTALYYAGSRGHVPMIKALLEAGADINHRAKSGKTALYWARQNKKIKAAQFLESHGATL